MTSIPDFSLSGISLPVASIITSVFCGYNNISCHEISLKIPASWLKIYSYLLFGKYEDLYFGITSKKTVCDCIQRKVVSVLYQYPIEWVNTAKKMNLVDMYDP